MEHMRKIPLPSVDERGFGFGRFVSPHARIDGGQKCFRAFDDRVADFVAVNIGQEFALDKEMTALIAILSQCKRPQVIGIRTENNHASVIGKTVEITVP